MALHRCHPGEAGRKKEGSGEGRGGGWGERKQSHMKLDEKISITHCNSI